MTFQPVIAGSGLVGWQFLQRTYSGQLESFSNSPAQARDTDYFAERIPEITSAVELVSDRRLLRVALGAFGLQEDIDNRAFVLKILQDGTRDIAALANRLADGRYREFSRAFGFGPGEIVQTGRTDFARDIVARYQAQAFEIAIGRQDNAMRTALYGMRELERIATTGSQPDTMWYRVMGLPPLRNLFETALALPSGFGQIDLEQQLDVFRDRTRSLTGSAEISQFSDPAARDRLVSVYMARLQIAQSPFDATGAATALQLLVAG